MFNYKEGFMLSYKEELSDMAAILNLMICFLVTCLCVLAGRGKFILKILPALLKLEFLDDSPHLGSEYFTAHMSPLPLHPLHLEV